MKDDFLKEIRQREKLFKSYGYNLIASRRYIFKKADLRQGRILEIGTGRGYFTAEIAKHGLTFISVDADSEVQKIARKYLRLLGLLPRVKFRIMNAENLPFADESFDCVVSVNLIHHLNKPQKCLKEMVRVTRTKLVIADLNKRGEKVLETVYKLNGKSHPRAKTSLQEIKHYLLKKKFKVKTYRYQCQTILVAQKANI